MQALPLSPNSLLEYAIYEYRRHTLPFDVFVRVLLECEVVIPSSTEIHKDWAGFTPLAFDRAGVPFLGVFTNKEHAKIHADTASYVLTLKLRDFLKALKPGIGIVINPGYVEVLEVFPEGIPNMLRDYPGTGPAGTGEL